MNKRALLILADALENPKVTPRKRFDYGTIVGHSWTGAKDWSCGTVGCALAVASAEPRLQKLGMRLFEDKQYPGAANAYVDAPRTYKRAAKVFKISELDCVWLFTPTTWKNEPAIKNLWGNGPVHQDATPKRVARHIREFVERGGADWPSE